MNRITSFAAAFALAALPAAAAAQSGPRPTIVGEVDYTRITEDDGYLGAGIGGGGGVRFHLTDATSVGVEVGRTHHVRDLGLYAVGFDANGRIDAFPYTRRVEGNATWLLGTISHAFGSARVRPLLWGGGGMMWHGGTTSAPRTMPVVAAGFVLQPHDLDSGRGPSVSALAGDGGIGVEVRASRKLSLVPFAGLRFANTANTGPKYIVRSGLRVVFRP
jgi:hypothetical protein